MACHASFNAYIYKLPHHHPAEKSHDCITAFLMLIVIALSFINCREKKDGARELKINEQGDGKMMMRMILFCFVLFC
jgi:hypothetical protein